MLTAFFRTVWRQVLRQKSFALLNVLGLAVGLACVVLIFLFVQLEYGFDRFHTKADRIYRVATEVHAQGGQVTPLAYTGAPMAAALQADFPEVETATRLFSRQGVLRHGATQYQRTIYFADPNFFEVFDFALLRGDPGTALARPGTLLLTQAQADAYFPETDPLGQSLVFADSIRLAVTGILADPPANSHLQYGLIASYPTLAESRSTRFERLNQWTYLLLREAADPTALEARLPDFAANRIGDWAREMLQFQLQPLTRIYFDSDLMAEIGPTGDRAYVMIFGLIGVFVLVVAGINFVNLATARAFRRAREVGVRKVLGAHRGQLLRQFLAEALLLVLVAFALALLLVELSLPTFSELAERALAVDYRRQGPWLLGLALLVGLGAGAYPAFFLSAFQPARVLKGEVGTHGQRQWLRQGLVVLQFGISIVLLIGTVTVAQQMRYVQDKRLGFEASHLVTLRLDNELVRRSALLKEELRQLPEVLAATAAAQMPGMPVAPNYYLPDGEVDAGLMLNTLWADPDYIATLGIELLAGRYFQSDRGPEAETAFVVNEATVRRMGWTTPATALGQRLTATLPQGNIEGTVVGVVSDFHYASLREAIQPLVIRQRPFYQHLTLRLAGDRVLAAMEAVEARWAVLAPDYPFTAAFLDERLEAMYQRERRFGEVFRYFAGLAILIACLGLFGLAAFTAAQRTKEVGIRKVLGASVPQVAALLSKEYLLLVLIANLLAWPVAYWAMQTWLGGFVYRIDLHAGLFAFGGSVALGIASLTVGYHALRTALTNPAETLRAE